MVDYDIHYWLPLTDLCKLRKKPLSIPLPFDFSEDTVKELIATLMIRKVKDSYENMIIIDFHDSLRLLSIVSLAELFSVCSERHIFFRCGLVNWKQAHLNSIILSKDARTLPHSRSVNGTPHLMSLYMSECRLKKAFSEIFKRALQNTLRIATDSEARLNISDCDDEKVHYLEQREVLSTRENLWNNYSSSIRDYESAGYVKEEKQMDEEDQFHWMDLSLYSPCINLDMDVNSTDISTGETLVFELIRKMDYDNLWYLLHEYQAKKSVNVQLNIFNKKGCSPLFYALRSYIRYLKKLKKRREFRPMDRTTSVDVCHNRNKIYSLILIANGEANFPVINNHGIVQSALGYCLLNQELELLLELIEFGARFIANELFKLAPLFLPLPNESTLLLCKMRWKVLVKICHKLEIPLQFIVDEHNNNPMHLLMMKEEYYNIHYTNVTFSYKIQLFFVLHNVCFSFLSAIKNKF